MSADDPKRTRRRGADVQVVSLEQEGTSVTYVHGATIKVIRRADGEAYVDIVARDDGLFEFRAYKLTRDEPHEYWIPTHQSGLFDAAETAEVNARLTVPWFATSL